MLWFVVALVSWVLLSCLAAPVIGHALHRSDVLSRARSFELRGVMAPRPVDRSAA